MALVVKLGDGDTADGSGVDDVDVPDEGVPLGVWFGMAWPIRAMTTTASTATIIHAALQWCFFRVKQSSSHLGLHQSILPARTDNNRHALVPAEGQG